MPLLQFRLSGVPVTQGSMSAFVRGGRVVVTDQKGARLKTWRHMVKAAAMAAAGPNWTPLKEPMRVHIWFGLPRPLREPKKCRTWPLRRGSDVDKLARAILDALTDAKIYGDDSQVIAIHAVKDWHDKLGMHIPGVIVRVYEMTEHTGPHTGPIPRL